MPLSPRALIRATSFHRGSAKKASPGRPSASPSLPPIQSTPATDVDDAESEEEQTTPEVSREATPNNKYRPAPGGEQLRPKKIGYDETNQAVEVAPSPLSLANEPSVLSSQMQWLSKLEDEELPNTLRTPFGRRQSSSWGTLTIKLELDDNGSQAEAAVLVGPERMPERLRRGQSRLLERNPDPVKARQAAAAVMRLQAAARGASVRRTRTAMALETRLAAAMAAKKAEKAEAMRAAARADEEAELADRLSSPGRSRVIEAVARVTAEVARAAAEAKRQVEAEAAMAKTKAQAAAQRRASLEAKVAREALHEPKRIYADDSWVELHGRSSSGLAAKELETLREIRRVSRIRSLQVLRSLADAQSTATAATAITPLAATSAKAQSESNPLLFLGAWVQSLCSCVAER